jgi:hypothetical protein
MLLTTLTLSLLIQTTPDLTAIPDHRATAQVSMQDATHEIEVRASGSWTRMTLPAGLSGAPYAHVMLLDYDTGDAAIFPVGRDVPDSSRTILRLSPDRTPMADIGFRAPDMPAGGQTLSIAGETCTDHVQDTQNAYGEIVRAAACFTPDGILLRQAVDGEVLYQVTAIERAPQSPALFETPQGYLELDMGGMAAAPAGEDEEAGVLNGVLGRYGDQVRDQADRRTGEEVEERTRNALNRLFGN